MLNWDRNFVGPVPESILHRLYEARDLGCPYLPLGLDQDLGHTMDPLVAVFVETWTGKH